METTSGLQWIENLCRTCMRDEIEMKATTEAEASHQWKCIFDTIEDETSSIMEYLTKVIPHMEVHANDELPKKICDECLQQLLNSYRFQQTCLQSEKQIRQLLAKAQMEVEIRIEQAHTEFVKSENGKENRGVQFAAAAADLLQTVGTHRDGELCMNIEPVNVNEFVKIEEEFDDYEAIFEPELKSECITTQVDECTSSEESEDWPQQQDNFGGSSPTHTCTLCSKTFKVRRYLVQHLRRHKQNEERLKSDKPRTRLPCEMCDKTYETKYGLKQHKSTKHYAAADRKETAKPETSKYQRTHIDSDVNTNGEDDSFRDAVKSDKPKRYSCKMCDKTYGSRRALNLHKSIKHYTGPDREETYTCEYCNKVLKKSSKITHIRIHKGEKPFLCPECGQKFRTSSSLKQHLMRHTGINPYECPDCPKKFPCYSDLAHHSAVHSVIKPYTCDICNSAFVRRGQLKNHKMYHKGEKQYKCEYCEKRFILMEHQRRHMRTHTGEKPYKCKYCTRAFVQSNDLIKHLRTHLGDKVYRCELCPSAFRLSSELRVHFAMHKSDDAETRERNLKALNEDVKLRERLVQREPEMFGELEEKVAELKGD